jgi:hypothetical protein
MILTIWKKFAQNVSSSDALFLDVTSGGMEDEIKIIIPINNKLSYGGRVYKTGQNHTYHILKPIAVCTGPDEETKAFSVVDWSSKVDLETLNLGLRSAILADQEGSDSITSGGHQTKRLML